MSDQLSPSIRTLAFGSLSDGPFAFVWAAAEGTDAVAVIGSPAGPLTATPVQVTTTPGEPAPDEPGADEPGADAAETGADSAETGGIGTITVTGDGIAIEAVPVHGALCAVTGTLAADGDERLVTSTGITTTLPVPPPGELEALRFVVAWFSAEEGIVYAAARPRKAKGQDADAVHATYFSPDGVLTIDDGRLSTTYLADGTPARMSLELWSDDEERPYPVRAAGEALSTGAAIAIGPAQLSVRPLACHRQGRSGLGAYALLRAS